MGEGVFADDGLAALSVEDDAKTPGSEVARDVDIVKGLLCRIEHSEPSVVAVFPYSVFIITVQNEIS